MQHSLYHGNWKERSQARLEQAAYRCEDCSIPYGTMRVGKHRHTLYFVHLHPAHINHDPRNPHAELRALCPACHMRHDRKTERKRATTRRQGYQVVSVSRLVAQSRCGGLHITQEESSCAWCIGDLSGVAGDVLDVIDSALHCLMMEPMEVQG
jgi:hypothetical protein